MHYAYSKMGHNLKNFWSIVYTVLWISNHCAIYSLNKGIVVLHVFDFLLCQISEEKIRQHFGDGFVITDCSLKYTRSGQFRQFAFIGFQSDEDAQAALDKFDKTFINTSRISIEFAKQLGSHVGNRAKEQSEKTEKSVMPKNYQQCLLLFCFDLRTSVLNCTYFTF